MNAIIGLRNAVVGLVVVGGAVAALTAGVSTAVAPTSSPVPHVEPSAAPVVQSIAVPTVEPVDLARDAVAPVVVTVPSVEPVAPSVEPVESCDMGADNVSTCTYSDGTVCVTPPTGDGTCTLADGTPVDVGPDAVDVGSAVGPFYVLEPCADDDGSGADPCYWDAAHRGNGVGTSYIVMNGTFYYPRQ